MTSFSNTETECVQALIWQDNQLSILDQRLLPDTIKYTVYQNALDVAEAIKTMQVRGAPAIGIAAAYAVVLSVQQHYEHQEDGYDWFEQVDVDLKMLAAARPTAVNLSWALGTMLRHLATCLDNPLASMMNKAVEIHQQDIADNHKMGKFGANVIGHAQGILTHCNAGSLATGGYGTALGVVRSVVSQNVACAVFACETRPWLQGARLTAWELAQDGIATTLIADSAAASLMTTKQIKWLVVGADCIAANGDVANKIGTYSLAILAKYHKLKVMVVAPSSTLNLNKVSGNDIKIEQRELSELLPECYQSDDSPVTAWNPVFDITPNHLINVIVTEQGAIFPPFKKNLKGLKDND